MPTTRLWSSGDVRIFVAVAQGRLALIQRAARILTSAPGDRVALLRLRAAARSLASMAGLMGFGEIRGVAATVAAVAERECEAGGLSLWGSAPLGELLSALGHAVEAVATGQAVRSEAQL